LNLYKYYIFSYNVWGDIMIIIEKNSLSVKYYEQILQLDDSKIVIKMEDNIIKIRGEKLNVSYYTNVEVVVHGTFSSIHFQ